MNPDQNATNWSFPLGTWFAVRVRVSIFFLFVLLILSHRLESVPIGLTFGLILFLSVLFHEFGHVFAARTTGGEGDEILITPFGGLAQCMPAPTFASRFGTVAGGPLVNLILCLITLLPVIQSQHTAACFTPLEFPPLTLNGAGHEVAQTVVLMLFKANWVLLLINLLPVHPLDGGRMLAMALHARLEPFIARTIYQRIGAIVGVGFILAGVLWDNTLVLLVGAIVLPLNILHGQQQQQHQYEADGEESFMGYDFSQGYTSLERSSSEYDGEEREGWMARRKAQREDDRRRREEEEEREMERRLDALLEKVHTHGEDSLTAAEKKQLKEISNRLRDRGS